MSGKEKILELVEKNAVEAQLRDDACAPSAMYGLSTGFDFITEEAVAAAWPLLGGTGVASGSCGAYCSGLMAIGLKYIPLVAKASSPEEALEKKELFRSKMLAYRDAFLKEYGTVLCPQIHKILFGRSFILSDDGQREDFLKIPDHAEKCATVVAKAARLAAKIILEDEILTYGL
jgi:hypothetical protein